MRSDLLVPRIDESDATLREFGEDGNVRMPTQAKHIFDFAIFKILDELL